MSVVSETIPHGKCRADVLCDYVSRGWSVFPVPPGTKKSYKSAERSGGRAWGMTRDPDEICRDFTRWPDAGIGIPTGAVTQLAASRLNARPLRLVPELTLKAMAAWCWHRQPSGQALGNTDG
jgi:bifunctional DNA primase/polymerase-like protein